MPGPKPNTDRIGKVNTMKCGLIATIIEYRSSASIDVQFEDGVVVTNQPYASFSHGKIGHPNFLHQSKKKNRVGVHNTMSNGMDAVVIAYRESHDIDIQFEDGEIRFGCAWKEFKNGNIAHPTQTSEAQAEARLGTRKRMNCGMEATVTAYRKYHDIDVQFEDGEEVRHVDWGCFKQGNVLHPALKDCCRSLQESAVYFYLSQLGFIKTHKGYFKDVGFGEKELDFYHPEKKIALEIDGDFHGKSKTISIDLEKNRLCHENGIKLYRLRSRKLSPMSDDLSVVYLMDGEAIYNGLVDCKGALEDILARNHIELPCRDFIDFKRDLLEIQNFHDENSVNYKRDHKIGEKSFHKTMKQEMTIIDYKDSFRVDIQFEDGTVVYGVNYGLFKKGEIKHPSLTPEAKRAARLGMQKTMNCGSVAKIIAYRTSEDMDVEFESGAVVYSATYYNFNKGNIKDPYLYRDREK